MTDSPRGVRGSGGARGVRGGGGVRGEAGVRSAPVSVPGRRDPYGLLPTGSPVAPVLSIVGLLVVAVITVSLFGGRLPFVSAGGGNGGGAPGVITTPAPPDKVIVGPKAKFAGSIVYAKQGSIWIQTDTTVRQLTTGANDMSPAWAPDGSYVYFIRSVQDRGLFPLHGNAPAWYTMNVPLLMRIKPAGGQPEQVATGKYSFNGGKYSWWYWLREPVPSPDGKTLALVSDGPNPEAADVVLQLFNLGTRKLTKVPVAENAPLGHQDPAWRSDGRELLYVRDSKDGPSIWRYDTRTKKATALTGTGYLAPSYSPDSRFVAATKTSRLGTDVVILDARTGAVVAQVTNDGASWSPVWSPAGDAVAFLHVAAGIVDLRTTTLAETATGVDLKDTLDLTQVSGLDGASRPSWYIPAAQLPPVTPAPSVAPAGSAAPSASGSAP